MDLGWIDLPTQTTVFGEKKLFHYGEPNTEACAVIVLVENLLATDPARRFLSCVESCAMPHTMYHEVCTGSTAAEALNACVRRWERYVQVRRQSATYRA